MSGYDLADEAGQVRAYNHLLGDTGFMVPHILRNQKEEPVKITVRHETDSSTNAPGEACVWLVGDDGEAVQTEYLKAGESVDIEIATQVKGSEEEGQIVTPTVTFGQVVPDASGETAGAVPGDPEFDQKADQRSGDDEPDGANDTSVLR